MTVKTIDAAIQAHLDWISRLKAALQGTELNLLDANKVGDDTACALGGWLSSEQSREVLGLDFHTRTVAIHGTFHKIAGEVATSLKQSDPPEVTQSLIAALEDLSRSLIEFLEFAKKRLEQGPRDWRIRTE